ncbi:unnamed protein product [Wickerhamomyces anomalus]
MKFMTTNFVKCSIKTCDSTTDSFPLKYQNCSLVQEEQEFNPEFIVSILDRLEWDATLKVAQDAMILSQGFMEKLITMRSLPAVNSVRVSSTSELTGLNTSFALKQIDEVYSGE